MKCCEFFIGLLFIFVGISVPVILNKINLRRWIVVLTECLSLVLMFVVFVFLREKGVLLSSENLTVAFECGIIVYCLNEIRFAIFSQKRL